VDAPLTLSKASAAHQNAGTLTIGGANFTVSQSGTTPSFTNTGAITVASGLTWTTNSGTLNLNGGGSVTGAGTLAWNSLTANLGADFSNATTGLVPTSATINGPGALINATSLTLTSTTVNAPLTNQGTLTVVGSVALNGALTAAATGTIQVQGNGTQGQATLTVASGFTNSGLIQLTTTNASFPAQLTVTAGTLVNASGATIAALAGAGGLRTLAVELENQAGGTLTVDAPLTLSKASAAHQNAGTLTIGGANFTVSQSGTTPSFTNVGTIDIADTRTLTVTGGGVLTNGSTPTAGVIQGKGTLNVSGTTFTNAGSVRPGTSPGLLTLTGNYVQSGPGTLEIELGGPAAGADYDRLATSGTATLGGTLTVTAISGFNPAGATFVILTYTGTPADFTTKNLPGGCTGAPGAGQYVITCN
jgi:hypothetical protein